MKGLFFRLATGFAPVAAIACAISLAGAFNASEAAARDRERPEGDWRRYCKDADVRGDWLQADCRRQGGGWRYNTRINFDNCPGNEVTVRDGYLVCERRYGGNGYNNGHGWDNDRRDRDRWDYNQHSGWDGRRDNDRRDWGRRDGDRNRNDRDGHDWNGRRDNDRRDGDRDWTKRQDNGRQDNARQDNDRRDGNWNGRRDDDQRQATRQDQPRQQRPDWNNGRTETRQTTRPTPQQPPQQTQPPANTQRDVDRRQDNRRRDDNTNREEWWKRGAG